MTKHAIGKFLRKKGTAFTLLALVISPLYISNLKYIRGGETTSGTVTRITSDGKGRARSSVALIDYTVENKEYQIHSYNSWHEVGARVTVLYKVEDPRDGVEASVVGFINPSAFQFAPFLIIVWIAYFLTAVLRIRV